MAIKRIKDLPAVTVPTAGDKLVLDGATARAIDIQDFMTAIGRGAGYGGTSATSFLIVGGSKAFATQTDLAYVPGNLVRAASAANGANYMEGYVTAYAAGVLTINVVSTGGAGTFADWGFAISGTPGADFGVPVLPSGRLSFSSTAAVPTTDLTGASCATLYYIDCGGGQIPIWDIASSSWKMRKFSGALSLALDSNAGHTLYHEPDQVFDVYAYWDSVGGQPKIGTTGKADYTFAQRGTNISDLTQKNGIWVNTLNGYLRINNTGNVAGTDYFQPGVNAATYLGSIGTVAAAQGEDSVARRLVFNAYNTQPRHAFKKYTGAPYAYSTATYRQVAADATMQVEMLHGLAGVQAEAEAWHFATSAAAPNIINTAIGLNGTAAIAATETFGSHGRIMDTAGAWPAMFRWRGYPGMARTVFKWLEIGAGASTQTWQANSDFFRNGVSVRALM